MFVFYFVLLVNGFFNALALNVEHLSIGHLMYKYTNELWQELNVRCQKLEWGAFV